MGRRALLTAFGASAAAFTLAACGPNNATPTDPTSHAVATDSLGPLYSETIDLVSAFDAALAAHPELSNLLAPLREDHRQHAVALASLLRIPAPVLSAAPSANPLSSPGTPTTGPGTPATSPGTPAADSSKPGAKPSTSSSDGAAPSPSASARAALAPLAATEKTAQANAVTACLAAPDDRAAILASIAACRATHLVVLS